MNAEKTGALIRALRTEQGLTQKQLADRLHLSDRTVSKWERGAAWPEMNTLLTLCEVFGVSLDTLLRGSAERSFAADTAGYDAHMDRFARAIALGVALVLAGVAFLMAFEGLRLYFLWDKAMEGVGVGGFMLFILLAAVIFIVHGIQHGNFCKSTPSWSPSTPSSRSTATTKSLFGSSPGRWRSSWRM